MFRLLLMLLLFVIGVAMFYDYLKKKQLNNSHTSSKKSSLKKIYQRYQAKADPNEIWVQVFESDNLNEMKRLKALLEEGDLQVILFEQAKKDIEGNVPPRFGITTPKSNLTAAQNIICRYLEHN